MFDRKEYRVAVAREEKTNKETFEDAFVEIVGGMK